MPTQRPEVPQFRFGDLLRRLRVARGVTQEMLAERTGLSVRGISDLERGVRNLPQRETLFRLIAGLHLNAEEEALLWSVARRAPQPRGLPGDERRSRLVNDPVAPGAFVGRAAELAAIMVALHDPRHRLVTLTGPPGVGKTRLAVEAAQRLDALVPTDVVVVDLAPIRQPRLVLPAIAAAIGLPEAGPALRERVQARLAARPTLLLLDNFEQLLTAASAVAELVQSRAATRFLVTSRQPLRIGGEYEIPVPPLATPRLTDAMRVGDVVAHEAVALFVIRARETDSAFHLTDANARAIAELCFRLDGLPLALELAAARVAHLPPAAIVARLAQRRPVLTAGRHDLPERQRTLDDAIDWSYDLLHEDEQRLFRRCSVFLGGFTVEAAEAIAAVRGSDNVPAVLASLADKSLLTRQPGRGGHVRCTMLETIREYGLARLAAHGEEAAVREIHAAYFLAIAERASRDFCAGAGQRAAIERLADEHDNVRQALAWMEEQTDPKPFLRLTAALWHFWSIHGHATEGLRWLERARARCVDAPPATRARTLIASARLAWVRGEFAAATAWLEQALALAPEPFDRCEALNALGDVAREQRDFVRAEAVLTEAIALARANDDRLHLGAALHNLGIVKLELGEHARARSTLEEGLASAQGMHNQYLAYSALHYLSRLAFEQGDLTRAAALRRDDLAVQRELAPLNAHGLARFFEGVALLAMVQDLAATAARFFGAAETRREEAEDIERAERRLIALWVAAARAALGGAAFEHAWAEGRLLSVATVLAEADALLGTWLQSGSLARRAHRVRT